ncbi:hypothetical protein [Mycoplasmopsis adleri]|uniref:hypothetical protein n=1 Tax=Mycoplasmopsis adleri TaxID=51362 RepID=UPI0038730607
MNKANKLNKNDTLAVVSLSSGVLGEQFCSHSVRLAKERAKQFGLNLYFTKHCLDGLKTLSEHPELRTKDLKEAPEFPSWSSFFITFFSVIYI